MAISTRPPTEDVERREVLGEDRRVAEVVVEHEAGDPEPFGRGGDAAIAGIGAICSMRWSGKTRTSMPSASASRARLTKVSPSTTSFAADRKRKGLMGSNSGAADDDASRDPVLSGPGGANLG